MGIHMAVKASYQNDFALADLFELNIGHIQPQCFAATHGQIFPQWRVGRVPPVLQLRYPELPVVPHGQFGTLASQTRAVDALDFACSLAAGLFRGQVGQNLKQFF